MDGRREMMRWYADYIDANREGHVGAFGFEKYIFTLSVDDLNYNTLNL